MCREGALETLRASAPPELRASAPPSLYTLDTGRVAMTSGNRIHRANGARFHYDDRDHVVAREGASGITYYLRDSADQLVKIDAPGLAWEAEYDALGRRTSKTVNGARTVYHWDDDRLSAEVFPDGRLRVYVYPDAGSIVPTMFVDYDSTEAEAESGRPYYVFTSHQGATELVLDAKGQAVWRARLDPYGTAKVDVGADFHQPLRWPGHFFDAETGLHYNRFRYYDPTLGRYLESDPLGIAGGANVYAPTANPLRDVDLRGLTSKCPNHIDCPDHPANKASQRPAGEENEAGVRVGEVASYGTLNSRAETHDQRQHDHIPSFGAVLTAVNQQRAAQGRPPLNQNQQENLRRRLTAVVEPDAVHRGSSPTYGGQNTAAQQAADAGDLRAAASRDLGAVSPAMQGHGMSQPQTDAMAAHVHAWNEQLGLYQRDASGRPAIPSHLWDD